MMIALMFWCCREVVLSAKLFYFSFSVDATNVFIFVNIVVCFDVMICATFEGGGVVISQTRKQAHINKCF